MNILPKSIIFVPAFSYKETFFN